MYEEYGATDNVASMVIMTIEKKDAGGAGRGARARGEVRGRERDDMDDGKEAWMMGSRLRWPQRGGMGMAAEPWLQRHAGRGAGPRGQAPPHGAAVDGGRRVMEWIGGVHADADDGPRRIPGRGCGGGRWMELNPRVMTVMDAGNTDTACEY